MNRNVLHPSGHMDPGDQVPALELLSRAASSVGTEGTIPVRKGPSIGSLAPGIRQRVKIKIKIKIIYLLRLFENTDHIHVTLVKNKIILHLKL